MSGGYGGCVVLYGEDNDGDAFLFEIALREIADPPQLFRTVDGESVMAFLTRTGQYEAAPTVNLLLLDLNLPKKNGFEILKEIKQDPSLCDVQVVIFSGSIRKDDRDMAMEMGASDYITKGQDLDSFVNTVKSACGRLETQ